MNEDELKNQYEGLMIIAKKLYEKTGDENYKTTKDRANEELKRIMGIGNEKNQPE